MSILKIKDSSGNWIPIPAIKGEPGDDYVLTAADKAEIAGLLIDDTATGDTDKTWSSDKIESELDSKISDVKINGTSVVDANGDAEIPIASTSTLGVIKTTSGDGLTVNQESGLLSIVRASDNALKSGSDGYRPVTPFNQHKSIFFGLSKAAGVDLTNETVTFGQYPEASKVAIQKMLGVYEAPWELIREDTFTNETEANVEITADDNGQSFELTDIRIVFRTPQQATQASVGSFGRCRAYFGDATNDIVYLGAYTQNANGEARTGMFAIEQRNNMILRYALKTIGNNSDVNIVGRNNYDVSGNTHNSLWEPVAQQRIYNKIVVEAVTGTATIKLYGRRKW